MRVIIEKSMATSCDAVHFSTFAEIVGVFVAASLWDHFNLYLDL